jgi:hypothetical protein
MSFLAEDERPRQAFMLISGMLRRDFPRDSLVATRASRGVHEGIASDLKDRLKTTD